MNFTRSIPLPNRFRSAAFDRLREMTPGFAEALFGASGHFDDSRRTASEVSGDLIGDFLLQLDPLRVAGAIANATPWLKFDLRKPLPAWLRRETAEAQDWKCHYGRGHLKANAFSGGYIWEIDHKWPVCRGGSDHPINLVAACRKHNRAKGAKVYTLFRIQLCLDGEARKCGN